MSLSLWMTLPLAQEAQKHSVSKISHIIMYSCTHYFPISSRHSPIDSRRKTKSLSQSQQTSSRKGPSLAGSPINTDTWPPKLWSPTQGQRYSFPGLSIYTHSQPSPGQLSPGTGQGCMNIELPIWLSQPSIFQNISNQAGETVNRATSELQNRPNKSHTSTLTTVSQNYIFLKMKCRSTEYSEP